MKKLLSGVVIVLMLVSLVYLGYWLGNRDLGSMYQPPLPEYGVVNTNRPAKVVHTEQQAPTNTDSTLMKVTVTDITLK